MSKAFENAKSVARRIELPEVMSLYGDRPMAVKDAIEVDWLHVLAVAQTDILEACRMTAPEDGRHRNRKLRRNLALLAVAAEEWEKRINN